MDIFKIVLGVITGVGGIGATFVVVVRVASNIIAKRLEEKYSLKLNKELEKYKSNLANKTYISKAKFDAEFDIYRNLSKSFLSMVRDIGTMIPIDTAYYPTDAGKKKEYEQKLYDVALNSCILAQDILSGNAPFIPLPIFNQYQEIMMLCNQQLRAFGPRWDISDLGSQGKTFTDEEYLRTAQINDKFQTLNNDIRVYLSKLDVLE